MRANLAAGCHSTMERGEPHVIFGIDPGPCRGKGTNSVERGFRLSLPTKLEIEEFHCSSSNSKSVTRIKSLRFYQNKTFGN